MRQIADVTVLHVVAEVVDVGREPESHAVDFRTLDLQGRDMMLEQEVSMLERDAGCPNHLDRHAEVVDWEGEMRLIVTCRPQVSHDPRYTHQCHQATRHMQPMWLLRFGTVWRSSLVRVDFVTTTSSIFSLCDPCQVSTRCRLFFSVSSLIFTQFFAKVDSKPALALARVFNGTGNQGNPANFCLRCTISV